MTLVIMPLTRTNETPHGAGIRPRAGVIDFVKLILDKVVRWGFLPSHKNPNEGPFLDRAPGGPDDLLTMKRPMISSSS
ncbi:hypothetical protein [Streptomyces olivaceoviridis]|uniref:hypothetical protein n=1 Tax=Streptomyces olivaceoviridis TaxID=1921 RepID=UPI003787ACD1